MLSSRVKQNMEEARNSGKCQWRRRRNGTTNQQVNKGMPQSTLGGGI
jgi:hypothetical protein